MQFYLFSTALIGSLAALASRSGTLSAEFVFCVSAGALLGLCCKLRGEDRLGRKAEHCILLILSAAAGLRLGSIVYSNWIKPPEWDFLCYWVYGLTAFTGAPFYSPKLNLAENLPIAPSDTFVGEVLRTPFHFPPPAAFLYSWLPAFSFESAALLWMLAMLGALLLCGWLLTKAFPNSKHSSLLPTAALLSLGPSAQTFVYCQTNFLMLLCLTLFILYRRSFFGGAILGIAALVVKPFAALLLLFALFRGRNTPLIGAACSATAMLTLSAIAFGWNNTLAYFVTDLPDALPREMFVQEINQSLLAATLRLTSYDFINNPPLLSPAFILIGFILTALTAIFTATADEKSEKRMLLSVLLLALLCYPATLTHYSVLLVLPILFSIEENEPFAPFLAVIVFALTSIDSWKIGTLALLVCWSWSVLPAAVAAAERVRQGRPGLLRRLKLGLNYR